MKRLSVGQKMFLRSFWVTAFMLFCLGTAIVASGYVYTVVEHNAFGREVEAFAVTSKDYITVFGREIYFPLVSSTENAIRYIKLYSGGIAKLLGIAVTTSEELLKRLIELINTRLF